MDGPIDRDQRVPPRSTPGVLSLRFVARHLPAGVAGLAGLLWFLLNGGARIVNPTRIDWMMSDDLATNLLGWLFFRNDPWRWPLGTITSYLYPAGATVGFTDSTPWVAVLLKPWSRLLPTDFQYVGIWLALCFALQGFVGAKLVKLASARASHQALGGALFALSPPLLWRVGHTSLCAHFVILALLWLGLKPCTGPEDARRTKAFATAIVVLTAGLHPYLTAMALALSLAILIRLWRVDRILSGRGVLSGFGWILGAALVTLTAFGYVSLRDQTWAGGYGEFSADLLTLVNPMGWSRLLPSWPTGPDQYEGYGYLGAGALALAAAALGLLVAMRRELGRSGWRRGIPVAVAVVLLAIYAAASPVTLAGRPIVGFKPLWDALGILTHTFRSSGRFIWPLDYLALAAAMWVLLRGLRRHPRWLDAALAGALALQVVDLRPRVDAFRTKSACRLQSEGWELARGAYSRFALYPPHIIMGSHSFRNDGAGTACANPGYPPNHYARIAYEAYRLGARINSGYVSRGDPKRTMASCEELRAEVEGHALAPGTLYVVHPSLLERFTDPAAHAVCGKLDGLDVCVTAQARDAFRRYLEGASPAPKGGSAGSLRGGRPLAGPGATG